ncbi:MAG: acetyl-CoA carboxylase biotin carboxyl carrier protein subunit [Bacteroidetes bacterium HGW-Bacteroidetes-1]|jgi:biotin carboxyl carrier protein|nr:MAG: acetyl-CoA carboxylase biotin carboxyl carrier protein subunit [Bacteroidetes bacterium HGW-Bacteroidetes-1]
MKKKKEVQVEKKTPVSPYSTLVIDNIEYQTLLTKKYGNRSNYLINNPYLLTAFIPGTIVEVLVVKGQNVIVGETLVVFEAMKMLNKITSPFDTNVKDVLVVIGDRVTKNQVLIELE